jgi:hypothetical protein
LEGIKNFPEDEELNSMWQNRITKLRLRNFEEIEKEIQEGKKRSEVCEDLNREDNKDLSKGNESCPEAFIINLKEDDLIINSDYPSFDLKLSLSPKEESKKIPFICIKSPYLFKEVELETSLSVDEIKLSNSVFAARLSEWYVKILLNKLYIYYL